VGISAFLAQRPEQIVHHFQGQTIGLAVGAVAQHGRAQVAQPHVVQEGAHRGRHPAAAQAMVQQPADVLGDGLLAGR
jgi:hypothetical protein